MNDPSQAGQPKKKNRIFLFVGLGCLGLIVICCCSGIGLYLWRTGQVEDGAQAHAEYFLTNVQTQNYAAAFASSEYLGDTSLYSAAQFQACLQATPLSDMASFACDDVDSEPGSDDADVTCTIQSMSQGPQVITIHVNSATDFPYLGFVWFSPGVTFGPSWSGDECARWSGRDYYEEPPPGRMRPAGGFGF